MKYEGKILLKLFKHNFVVSDEEGNSCMDNELGITYGKYSVSASCSRSYRRKSLICPWK